MKLDGYQIIQEVLEARFNLPSAKKARLKVANLKSQYAQEQDPQRRANLRWDLKKAQSDLALKSNSSYDHYRSEGVGRTVKRAGVYATRSYNQKRKSAKKPKMKYRKKLKKGKAISGKAAHASDDVYRYAKSNKSDDE